MTSETAGIEKLLRATEQLPRDLGALFVPGPEN